MGDHACQPAGRGAGSLERVTPISVNGERFTKAAQTSTTT
jgi:hypothetical protein